MKNSWLIWTLIIGAVVLVFVVFNYQGKETNTSLTEVFPEEGANALKDVEYEFVDSAQQNAVVEPKGTKSVSSFEDLASHTSSAPKTSKKTQASASTKSETSKLSVNKSSSNKTALTSSTAKATTMTPAVSANKTAAYTIQISSFKEKSQADAYLAKIKQKESLSYVYSKEVKDKGMWYRVCVGQFANKTEAESYLEKVKTVFKNSFILALQ